jgi:hypothetical protein
MWLRDRPSYSIADIAKAAGWVSDTGIPNKAKVLRCLRNLKREKLARNYRKKWSITDAGKKELDGKSGGDT